VDVPVSQTHRFRSNSFYWSGNSQFVTFADSVQDIFSVVLASITPDRITAYVHPISSADICSGDPGYFGDTSDLTMKRAEITSAGSSTVILAIFESADRQCTPKQATLGLTDFKFAETEVWEHRKLKPSTPIKHQ
jgi:hypothetical protein